MTIFFSKIFTKYPTKTRRLLEILPGFFSWMLILFPLWGSLAIPYFVAYFILFFDVYWLYKSFSAATTSFIASNRIKEAESKNWLEKASGLSDFEKVNHIIIIPNFKEKVDKLRDTIKALANQTFSTKRLFIILAMEKREQDARQKANVLIREFNETFGQILATTDEGDFFCAGYSNILDMPEFLDIDITRNLLSVIDEMGYFDAIFSKIENDEDIHILFGEDLGPKLSGPYGSVFAHYKTSKHAGGEIGVIGPTRLNYTYVVPAVRYFSNLIRELAEGW